MAQQTEEIQTRLKRQEVSPRAHHEPGFTDMNFKTVKGKNKNKNHPGLPWTLPLGWLSVPAD